MTDPVPSKERIEAIAAANRLLDCPFADPDDDERIVARQFLREIERATYRELKPAHEREPPHCASCSCPPYQAPEPAAESISLSVLADLILNCHDKASVMGVLREQLPSLRTAQPPPAEYAVIQTPIDWSQVTPVNIRYRSTNGEQVWPPAEDPMRPTMVGGAPAAVVEAVADAVVRNTDADILGPPAVEHRCSVRGFDPVRDACPACMMARHRLNLSAW